MKVGMIKMREVTAIIDPRSVRQRARWPWPIRRSSCPGRVARAESSSGAPRNIAGMKSRNVWVIAIAVMKIRRVVVGRPEIRDNDKIEMAIRLM